MPLTGPLAISVSLKNECLINGKKVRYHAMQSGSLEVAKNDLEDFKYIGSGKQIYINDIKLNEEKELFHFFIRK